MAAPTVSYQLLPWTREGIASTLKGADSSTAPAVAEVSVELSVDGELIQMPWRLYGPGDVRALDTSQVIRTDPVPNALDFESNCWPAVEFRRPDLPWMFTPVANAGDHLRPWFCLVVVPATAATVKTDPALPFPVLHLESAGMELPDLGDVWATAHVQVTWVPDTAPTAKPIPQQLQALIAANHPSVISRLLSFRRLDRLTAYHACVVPTFDIGRKAGLGQDPLAADEQRLAPAWTAATGPLDLPVFYHWQFQTGPGGDFESLARALERVGPTLPPTVGQRLLDTSHPGYGMPSGGVLGMVGAIDPALSSVSPWSPVIAGPFQSRLRDLVNRVASSTTGPTASGPLVGPPLYAAWYAAQRTLPPAGSNPLWLTELNLDPRHRAAAALGAAVVHRHQEELMASAWDQLAHLKRANQMLRQAQLARTVATATLVGHLAGLSAGALVQLTRPVHARLRSGPTTIARQVDISRVPNGAFSPALRRLASPQGAIGRRLLADGGRMPMLVTRLNQGLVVVAPPRRVPDGTIDMSLVTSRAPATFATVTFEQPTPQRLDAAPGWSRAAVAPAAAPTGAGSGSATAVAVRALAARTSDTGWGDGNGAGDRIPKPPGFTSLGVADFLIMKREFLAAARRHQAYLSQAQTLMDQPTAAAPTLSIDNTAIATLLEPDATVLASVRARLDAPATIWARPDPLDPMKEAPQFPQPMMEPLAEISQEWLLAGLGDVPHDAVYIMEEDAPFLESYMVGLNHEMGRVLQWNEYPFFQRATFFRYFWPAGGAQGDIPEIANWDAGRPLGGNAQAWSPKPLILVVRSTMLQRYPDTAIYARQAQLQGGRRTATGERRDPLFRARLDPDMTFFGFNLSRAEAVGDAQHPGWFFILEQHPHQPRFGLRDFDGNNANPQDWEHASWSNLGPNDAAVSALRYAPMAWPRNGSLSLPLRQGQPDSLSWGQISDAGAMAAIALRDPIRVILHASALLGGR